MSDTTPPTLVDLQFPETLHLTNSPAVLRSLVDASDEGLGFHDRLDGGAGSDFALFDENLADYTLTRTSATEVTIMGPDGTDSLIVLNTSNSATKPPVSGT